MNTNMDMTDAGIWIKVERLNRHISQAKLAKLLGINQAILSDWERGKRIVKAEDLDSIKSIFIKVDKLSESEKDKFIQRRKYKQTRYDVPTNGNGHIKKRLNQLPLKIDYDKPLNEKFAGRKPNSKPKGIALFAGCGGLSLGFHKAGFDVLGYVELEHSFHPTYEKNFPESFLLGDDVKNVKDEDVKEWKNTFGEIDVLFGGPPCQGFSLAGKRDVFDPRNELYLEFVRIASILKPKTILLENVRLLTSMKLANGNYASEDIVKRFQDIGYEMSYQVVNAMDYGVPQSRQRVIFIGVRKDLATKPIVFPTSTHGTQNGSLFNKKPYVTFRNATIDLESLESGEKSLNDPLHFAITHPDHVIKWLKNVPEGESAHDNPDPSLRPTSGYNTTYKRIKWDEPSSTISTNFSMISGSRNVHPTNTRSLTIREAARCQTFPDNFKWDGKWGTIRKMIGNAVPPLLAEVMAKHILRNYLTEEDVNTKQSEKEVYKNIQLQD